MIVKVVKNETSDQKYWIFDNIVKISVSKKISKNGDIDADVFFVDTEGVNDFVRLICRDVRDKEFSIAFDTIAYICNDEGKTIEIVPVSSK